jgi:hypothetical protein
MSSYRVHLLQALKKDDKVKRLNFCCRIHNRVENDKSVFHLSGKAYHHNVCIWGTVAPHVGIECGRDSPKVDVFCAMSCTQVFSPFFFAENMVTGTTYLDTQLELLIPQLQED